MSQHRSVVRKTVLSLVVGVVATTCSIGASAAPASSSSSPSASKGPSSAIIVVGGRSGSRMPLNPQPLPPRW